MSKYTKQEANYTDNSTSPVQKCGACIHYNNYSCDIVKGKIEPQGWCIYWKSENLEKAFQTLFNV